MQDDFIIQASEFLFWYLYMKNKQRNTKILHLIGKQKNEEVSFFRQKKNELKLLYFVFFFT